MSQDFKVEMDQARVLRESGDLAAAAAIYERVLAQDARNYEANFSLGMLYHIGERSDLAIPLIQKSVDIRPEKFFGHVNLGMIQREEGLLEDARASFKKAVELETGAGIAHATLGICYMDLGELDLALESLTRGQELEPGDQMILSKLGTLYQVRGELDAAAECFNKLIARNPGDSAAHRSLALLRKQTGIDDNVRWLEAAAQAPERPEDDRMLSAFTLGKVFDDLGEYDKAFGYLQQAHHHQLRITSRQPETEEEFFARHKQHLDAGLVERCQELALKDETPIFVVGMPRSGTSLTEQILASHPDVYGAGEVIHLKVFGDAVERVTDKPFPEDIGLVAPQLLSATARKYIEKIRRNAGEATRVVDKVPNNFLRVGLIAAVMPRARIVLCERNPLDNCLSIFHNPLGPGHAWASDLAELGNYYHLYRDLVEYWEEILPGHMYHLRYEDLVDDNENQVRQLLDHCGLPFHEDCIKFHETQRQVRTPSEAQVRQPVYKSSVGRWKNYEQHLGPLIESLGDLA